MVAVWPAGMPQKLEENGFQGADADGLLRSQPDIGPAKLRQRSSAMPKPIKGQMTVTVNQIAIARAFAQNALLGRALPFSFPDPLTGSPILVRLTEPLSWQPRNGPWWTLSLSLEVLP